VGMLPCRVTADETGMPVYFRVIVSVAAPLLLR
jgi:hypothetical protein